MTKLELAAETWAKIETILTTSALPDDRLTAERPRCIAVIAEALGARVSKKRPVPPVPEEKIPLIDFPKAAPRAPRPLDSPHMHTGYLGPARGPSSSLEAALTKRLDQIIDQSINRKVGGYSADDKVDH